MNYLISDDPSILIMSWCAFLMVAGIVYALLNSLKELDQFRANLKTGDMVRVKFQTEVFRARIVSRYDEFTVIVKNIDTKEISHSATKNIFQV